MILLVLIPAFMFGLIFIAAPIEFACRHNPAFAAFLDRLVDRVLGQ